MSRFSGLTSIYDGLIALGENLQSIFLLLLRFVWGYQFFVIGLGKFATIPAVTSFFHNLGIPFARQNAYIVASIETIGGMLLILGLATRLTTIPLIATMVVAYLTAHIDAVRTAFENPQNFFAQGPFTFLFVCVVLFIFGPGRISLDYLIERMIRGRSTK